jgi:hypothetical protein
MSVSRIHIVALLLLALTACTTPEQQTMAACERLGAPPGSDEYWPCVQQQGELRQRRAEMFSGMAVSGAAMLQPPPSIYVYRGY